jgi:hypothetical protein
LKEAAEVAQAAGKALAPKMEMDRILFINSGESLDKGLTAAISFPKFIKDNILLHSKQIYFGNFLQRKVPSCYARRR